MRIAAMVLLSLIALSLLPASGEERGVIEGWVLVPAVSGDGGSVINVTMKIIYPGSGKIVVTSSSGESFVSELTRYSMIMAFSTASLLAGYYWGSFDVVITLKTRERVAGPSGGFAVSLLAFSLLTEGRNLGISGYTITGSISPEGMSSRVGGVDVKCRVSQERGLKLMLPLSNVEDLQQSCRARSPVAGLIEARSVILGLPEPEVSYNLSLPQRFYEVMREEAQRLLADVVSLGVRTAEVNSLINRARENLNASPYSAASLAFSAYVEALRVKHAERLPQRGYFEQTIDALDKRAKELRGALDGAPRDGSIYYAEFLATAYTRLADAEARLASARALHSRGAAASEVAGQLALAEARLRTVEVWRQAAMALRNERPLVSAKDLELASRIFGSYVELATDYAVSYLDYVVKNYRPANEQAIVTSIDIIKDLVRKGREQRQAGNHLASIGFYRESLSRSLSTISSQGETLSREVAERYLAELRRIMSFMSLYSFSRGYVSGLAPAYAEYSAVRYGYGDYGIAVGLMQEAVASVILWSTLAISKPSVAFGNIVFSESQTPTAQRAREAMPVSWALVALTAVSSFVIGFMISALLYVRALRRY